MRVVILALFLLVGCSHYNPPPSNANSKEAEALCHVWQQSMFNLASEDDTIETQRKVVSMVNTWARVCGEKGWKLG